MSLPIYCYRCERCAFECSDPLSYPAHLIVDPRGPIGSRLGWCQRCRCISRLQGGEVEAAGLDLCVHCGCPATLLVDRSEGRDGENEIVEHPDCRGRMGRIETGIRIGWIFPGDE
jgi:hypothetical protein